MRRPFPGLLGLPACLGLLSLAACASAGDPPGGPPDTTPPSVIAVSPDSGAIDSVPPKVVDIRFDEVIGERVAASKPDLGTAILLSPLDPDTVPPKVEWHRDHITIVPKHGYRPGRVYRVELLPYITDLRTNKMKQGHLYVFSTGPAIPSSELRGTLVDWVASHAATQGLIEAVDLRDSLTYRALTDSAGNFRMPVIPPGDYLVYGTVDQNNDRRRQPREAFDSVRVTLADTARAELYAFVHDTTGPRIRRVEVVDSLTLRVTFTAPLDPHTPPDTSRIHIAPYADSTALSGVAGVMTQAGLDSLRAAERARADSLAKAKSDSIANARADSLRRAGAADTTRHAPADTTGMAPLPGARRPTTPRDSTIAQKMLARRPPPLDTRLVRLLEPLAPATRYYLCADSVRSISLLYGDFACNQFVVPRPPPPPPQRQRGARSDTTRADTTRTDTTRSDTTRADSTRRRPDR